MVSLLQTEIRLMEEVLHHLGCIKPCTQLYNLPINWCRISFTNRMFMETMAKQQDSLIYSSIEPFVLKDFHRSFQNACQHLHVSTPGFHKSN